VVAAVTGLSWSLTAPAWAAEPRHTSPIQISDDGATVWVANPDSDSVGKIATATDTLTGEYPVGDNPRTVALGGGSVYVANQGSQDLTSKVGADTLMRLDQGSGGVQAAHQLPFGCAPYGVIFNEAGAGGAEVYVSCERRQEVLVLDAALGSVLATVPDWSDLRDALSAVACGLDAALPDAVAEQRGARDRIDTWSALPVVARLASRP
jgi:YVTN family beta-propeller protein